MPTNQQGKELFGKWLEQARTSNETKKKVAEWLRTLGTHETVGEQVNQSLFGRWISAQTGIPVSEGIIGRAERADGKASNAPPIDVLYALVKSKVLKLPSGKNPTLEDLVKVFSAELNPLEGESDRSEATNGSH